MKFFISLFIICICSIASASDNQDRCQDFDTILGFNSIKMHCIKGSNQYMLLVSQGKSAVDAYHDSLEFCTNAYSLSTFDTYGSKVNKLTHAFENGDSRAAVANFSSARRILLDKLNACQIGVQEAGMQ